MKRNISRALFCIGIISCMSFNAFAASSIETTDCGVVYVTDETLQIPVLRVSPRNAIGQWHSDDTGWWFEYSGGGYPHDTWEEIDHRWYYFKSDGYMATGWVQVKNVCYFCEDSEDATAPLGSMVTGWRKVKDEWYYLETAGTSTIPLGSMRTGWIEKSVNSYYLRPEKEGTHPMGSMVTGSKDIDNVRYFFNTLGEKTLLLQNKDRIVYAFADGDIGLGGGTVRWDITANVSNESSSQIKVTDRTGFCSYTTVNDQFGVKYKTYHTLAERNDHDNTSKNFKWDTMSIIYPSEETPVFCVENHYDSESGNTDNLSIYDRENRDQLSYSYTFGTDNPVGVTHLVYDSGKKETHLAAWHTNKVIVDYNNVPEKYSTSESEDVTDLSLIDSLFTIDSQPHYTFLTADDVFTGSNAARSHHTSEKYSLSVDKNYVDTLRKNYALLGSSNIEGDIHDFLTRKGVLYAEALLSNGPATDDDVEHYKAALDEVLDLQNNELYQHIVAKYGGESNYWNTRHVDATIQKYLDEKKAEFLSANHLINSLEADQLWQDYRESLISDLQQKYTLLRK